MSSAVSGLVVQTFPLGQQWPTLDPFLFCVHHDDEYPAGTAQLTPSTGVAGRNLGRDFSGRDGWSMYHGSSVPGFPKHPHRGFETISFVRQGLMDHADSTGATARFGAGDVQWMTAGRGVQHSEMFPLLNPDGPNPVELFQIWLNLPAEDKMVEPHFSMLWDRDIPRIVELDDEGREVVVTCIAGDYSGAVPAAAPPHSWASRADADVAIWHIVLAPHATWTLPAATGPTTSRALYLFEGGPISVGGTHLDSGTGAVLHAGRNAMLVDSGGGSEALLLQGRPIGEPVAQYGPFVMNSRAEIEQAFDEYQRTQFGGWPWESDDPNHGPEIRRFARQGASSRGESEVEAAAAP